ncbi:unnamed protein product [Caenorhabditis auriculariae]|uniref:PCI domain-containing protein 2 homolog n=1 Tax=Caenorhabditis auriculariae TaxID=2777116 RepID=A0A8S1H4D0_9PELO|nr:unnamed protein product [Caenorhabditis auriculariae]
MTRFPDIDSYFSELQRLINSYDWNRAQTASSLFSMEDDHSYLPYLQVESYGSRTRRSRLNDEVFDEMTCLHLHVLYCVHVANDFVSAHSTQIQIVQLFNKEILQKRKEENWFMPIFYQLCTDLRILSKEAEDVSSQNDDGEAMTSFYEQAANCLMECYRACVSDVRTEIHSSKKVAMLNLTNQLFRIYFKINKLNLLKPLIRAIENCGPLYQEFSMADKVTYNYYLGRKAMFDADLPLAEKSLNYAFRNCPRDCMSNKRRVLIYLIPVKMFLGHMPTHRLLHDYKLDEFEEVVEAVKDGNLGRLDRALEQHEKFFIKSGIFLMLEKLRSITFRTLFKKVCSLLGGSIFLLEVFLCALSFAQVNDVDVCELECIMANLIAEKKIKGYISHQHGKLVISKKQEAFPALSSISAAI